MKDTLRYIYYSSLLVIVAPLLPVIALIDLATGGALVNRLRRSSTTA